MPPVTTVPAAPPSTASVLDGLAAPLPPPRGCTHFQLRQLSRRLGLLYDAELAAVGLKTTQFSLLSSLHSLGPVRPADLARAMKLEPSTLTRNLQPLLAAGWAQIGPGPDGRSRTVRITPAGEALRAQARERWHQAQLLVNATLGEQRVAALHALIQESLTLLADAGEETPHG